MDCFFFIVRLLSKEYSFRQRFVAFFTSPGSNLYFFYGIIFLLLCSSVFISLCRGGIITILLSCLLFAVFASVRLRKFGRASFWIALCLVLLFITSIGWQPIFDEFSYAINPNGGIRDARIQLWGDTLGMIKDYPLLGAGFGTYVDVYPSYKTIATNLIIDHAHNDYLEMLTDGGIVSFLLAAWFCLALLLHGWRKIRVRRDRFAILLGVGAFTGICAALMHIVVDFNLHNGAVGLYFFFLCGLMVAIVNTRYNYHETESLLSCQQHVDTSRSTGTCYCLFYKYGRSAVWGFVGRCAVCSGEKLLYQHLTLTQASRIKLPILLIKRSFTIRLTGDISIIAAILR